MWEIIRILYLNLKIFKKKWLYIWQIFSLDFKFFYYQIRKQHPLCSRVTKCNCTRGWHWVTNAPFAQLDQNFHEFAILFLCPCKFTENVLVFCYQNCSDLLWEKIVLSDREKLLKFEAKSREFSKILRSPEQFIQTVKGHNNFW